MSRKQITEGRELHEVVRDAEGKITGVLRPVAPDVSGAVLDHARNDGFREGYERGAQAGADAAASVYMKAGVGTGYAAGLIEGAKAGFKYGLDYPRRWPTGDGPKVVDLRLTQPTTDDGGQAA